MNIFKLVGSIMVDSSDADKSLQKTDKNVEGVGGKFLKGIGTAAKWGAGLALAAGTAAAAVIGLSVNVGEDLQKALNGLQAETGTTDKAMIGMKDSLLAIYNNNFGESFEDIGKSMATVAKATGLTGDALEFATQNALLLRDTFGFEVEDSIKGADALMKQFGMTSGDSFNLMTAGAQAGLDKNGDFLDTLNEYSPTFAAQGFSAEQMFNMLSNASKSGIRDVDLAADAIKEFGIRSKDGSDASAEGFALLGLNAKDMTRAFAEGGETGKNAFQIVTDKLAGMKDPAAQSAAAIALFGTQAEDMGIKGIIALSNMEGGISGVEDHIEALNAVKYNTFGEAMQGIKRNLETGILLPISEKVLPVLSDFSNWVIANMPAIQTKIETVMGNISGAFQKVYDFVQANMPTIQATMKTVFDGIKIAVDLAIQGFKLLVDSLTTMGTWISENQALVENIGIIVGSLAAAWGLVNAAIAIWNVIGVIGAGVTWLMTYGTTAFGLALLSVNWPLVLIVAGIAALIAIGVLLYKNWDVVKAFAVSIWTSIKDFFSSIFSTIKGIFTVYVNAWKLIITTVFNVIKTIITTVLNVIKVIIATVFNTIKILFMVYVYSWMYIIKTVFNVIKFIITNVMNGIKIVITTVFNAIKTVITTILNGIKAVTSSVWNGIKSTISNIVNGIKSTVSSIFNSIKSTVTSVWNSIKSTTTSVWNGIKTAITTPIEAAKNKVKTIIDTIKGFFAKLKLKIPEISIPKLPKLKVTGKFSVAPPSIPKFNWYAKGGEFDKPTIAGLGEDGREAIVPLEKNTGWADRVASLLNSRSEGTNENGSIILNIENFVNNREEDIKRIMEEIEFYRKQAAIGR